MNETDKHTDRQTQILATATSAENLPENRVPVIMASHMNGLQVTLTDGDTPQRRPCEGPITATCVISKHTHYTLMSCKH